MDSVSVGLDREEWVKCTVAWRSYCKLDRTHSGSTRVVDIGWL